jgi:hypothetical protein
MRLANRIDFAVHYPHGRNQSSRNCGTPDGKTYLSRPLTDTLSVGGPPNFSQFHKANQAWRPTNYAQLFSHKNPEHSNDAADSGGTAYG